MTKINVNADMFAACGAFVTSEETRYYLKGVFITPHVNPETGRGVLMVATDGHRMACFHDEFGTADAPVIVAAKFTDAVLKTTSKETGQRRLVADFGKPGITIPGTVYMTTKGAPDETGWARGFCSLDAIDGTYPEFRRIIPRDTFGVNPSAGNGFNPVYMLDVRKAINRSGIVCEEKGLRLFQKEKGDPFLVTTGGMHDAVFVVMPMRINGADAAPEWLAQLYAPEAEAA